MHVMYPYCIGGEILVVDTCDKRTGNVVYKRPNPGNSMLIRFDEKDFLKYLYI